MASRFTARQGQFLAFIHGFIARRGIAPSFEEIGSHFGTTLPSVNTMVKTLERNGLISRVPGVARSLRVLVPASELPPGDLCSRRPRAAASRQGQPSRAGASVADAAGAAAIAVLDAVMPHWLASAGAQGAAELVMKAAQAVRSSLAKMGLDETTAGEVANRVGAEASRWSADGRGTVVRRMRWVKRK